MQGVSRRRQLNGDPQSLAGTAVAGRAVVAAGVGGAWGNSGDPPRQ
jgi:hypothetical protein